MARPTVTGTKQRTQVGYDASTPQLNVTEPLDVPTGPSAAEQSWGQLQQALGTIAPAARQFNDAQTQQGQADAMMGHEDPKRAKFISSYSDGVEKAHVILQAQDAFNKVQELADKLPYDMPPHEKTQFVDSQLMAELGPLAQDPKARLLIHEQYSDFIQKYAGKEMEVARAQDQATVEDSFQAEVVRAVQGGNVDFGKLANDGAAVFPGGRSEAWRNIVEMTAQQAEEKHDPTILDMLPAKVQTEDGQSIDSPILSKENKARIQLSRARIEEYQRTAEKPEIQWKKAQYLRPWEDQAELGLLTTDSLPLFKDGVTSGLITADEANGLINKSVAKKAELDKLNLNRDKLDRFRIANGGRPWRELVNAPVTDATMAAPKDMGQAQDLVNQDAAEMLKGYAVANKLDRPPILGADLKQYPQLVDQVFTRSLNERLPYDPLKAWMNGINPAMGQTVLDRLDVYRLAKSRGVENLYIDNPEQQAVFESALGAIDAGEKPEQVVQTINHLSDPSVRAAVAAGHKAALAAALSGKWDVQNKFFDANTSDISNMPYVTRKVSELTDLYLSRGVPNAGELAHQRFADTHFAVNLNGHTVMVPNAPLVATSVDGKPVTAPAWDDSSAAVALQKASELAPAYAQKLGDPKPENATVTVVFGRNGRDTEVHYVGSDGVELNTKPITIQALIGVVQKAHPADFKDMVKENRDGQERRRLLTRPNTQLLSQPKY